MKDDILKEARDAFELAADYENENRNWYEEDLEFARQGDQWPYEVRKKREIEGRPCLTINRLPSFVRQVANDARQNRPQIAVHPVDGDSDPETAKVLSGLIRNIEYSSDADTAYDTAIEHALYGGFGYFRIAIDYACEDSFDKDILIKRIAEPLSVYGDPHSKAADSSDWNNAFIVEAMPKALFERKYPNAEKVDWEHDFTGLEHSWFDGENVLVAEWWRREEVDDELLMLATGQIVAKEAYETSPMAGLVPVIQTRPYKRKKVTQIIMTGAEVLEEVAWPGKYIPIVPVYGEEWHYDGKRYFKSLIRDAKDAQRMFNYWRSTSTELVALAPKAPFIGPKGAFETDAEKWATANTDSHAFIEYDGAVAPQRQPFAGVPAGALQEALNAADDMKSIVGIYDASLGARSNETSGRAIMARQREGDVSTFHFIDNLSRAIRHAGRILVDIIPKVYGTERIVRVLGEDETPSKAAIGPQDGQPPEGFDKLYDLAVGKYDVAVKAGPSFTTRREEAAVQMTEFVRAFPPAAPMIGDLLVKNLDWPGADEIAERLKPIADAQMQAATGGQGGADPAMMQQAAQQAQVEQQQMMIEAQAKQAELEIKQGELQLKEREIAVKEFEAQTDRYRVEMEARRPVQQPDLIRRQA